MLALAPPPISQHFPNPFTTFSQFMPILNMTTTVAPWQAA
jgi:hypothetical protein